MRYIEVLNELQKKGRPVTLWEVVSDLGSVRDYKTLKRTYDHLRRQEQRRLVKVDRLVGQRNQYSLTPSGVARVEWYRRQATS